MFVTDLSNDLLGNDAIKFFIVLLTGVFAGYTLQPVPAVLDKLFNESWIFKYITLFMIAATVMHPLTDKKLGMAFIMPAVILFGFSVLRE